MSFNSKLLFKGIIISFLAVGLLYFAVRLHNPLFLVLVVLVLFPALWEAGTLLIARVLRGREGEKTVEEFLHRLPAAFHVLPNVVLGTGGNIDFLVVGPTGIFTIEAKSHSGRITFDGEELRRDGALFEEKDFLKQAWAESLTLRDFLKTKLHATFEVQPTIVFSSPRADVRFGYKKVKGVYVLGPSGRWLRSLICDKSTQTLTKDRMEQIIATIAVVEK